jgi:hypothetical protein
MVKQPAKRCGLCSCAVSVLTRTDVPEELRPIFPGWQIDLCDVCYKTFAGHAWFYSDVERTPREVIIVVGQIGNLILEELRKRRF